MMATLLSARGAPSRRALYALSSSSSSASSFAPLSSLFLSRPAPCPSSLLASSPLAFTQVRNSAHASQGRANRAKRGPGKRLGLKKGATEPVVPGNIIFRQRGTGWFAGENCVMGRDHTINALQPGFVRYYRDPARHPTRKYIGVVLSQDDVLPRVFGQARRRRLGLVARPMAPDQEADPQSANPSSSSPSLPQQQTDQSGANIDVIRTSATPESKKLDASGYEALGIPLPRTFTDKERLAALGRTRTDAQIGALADRLTAKLKYKSRIRARTKLRIFRARLNKRDKRSRWFAAGKLDKSVVLRDAERARKRRRKSRHRGKR